MVEIRVSCNAEKQMWSFVNSNKLVVPNPYFEGLIRLYDPIQARRHFTTSQITAGG